MESLVHQPIYELFLVLERLRSRHRDLAQALAPLSTGEAPPVRGVDIYHRAASDVALVAVRFDERAFSHESLRWLVELTTGAGIPLIDPTRMSETDRRSFYQSYLGSYETHVEDQAGIQSALVELGRRVDLGMPRLRSPSGGEISPPVTPPRGPLGKLAPAHSTLETRAALPLGEQMKRARERGRSSTRAPTSPALKTPTPTSSLTPSPVSVTNLDRTPAPRPLGIGVSFLRGGQWTPARLRALSLKGAYVVTGAPPRLGDSVHVALELGDCEALVRGTVYHVTTAADAAYTGASGFAVRFPGYACPGREQLVELLRRARSAGVTIKPPPSRSAVRFPVRWPVQLGTNSDGVRGDALDVSVDGMFVAIGRLLGRESDLSFGVPLDVGDVPITGRATVVRELGDDDARIRGLRSGYGLHIVDMSETDRRRWSAFLTRVQRRTEKRVLVGASAARLVDLSDALTAAGYTVTAGSDPGVLMRLADLEPRPPDAAVIDGSLDEGGGNWLERALLARQVPCVAMRGESATRTRSVVDRLLQVGPS